MTYCCALRLKQGLVFISDTRTNAGVDHISVYRKLYTFGVKGERFICIQTSGNLATT
ncbi:MAG: peptidase, partial [Acinetobacter guillouiae]